MLLQYVQHSLSSGGGEKHQADAAATAIRALNGVYRPRFSPMFHSFHFLPEGDGIAMSCQIVNQNYVTSLDLVSLNP